MSETEINTSPRAEGPEVREVRNVQLSAVIVPFLALLVLTAGELLVIRLPAAPETRPARITALVGLAMLKAGTVLSFFMDLKNAGRALRRLALLPILLAPPIAVVFMLEAAYRAGQR